MRRPLSVQTDNGAPVSHYPRGMRSSKWRCERGIEQCIKRYRRNSVTSTSLTAKSRKNEKNYVPNQIFITERFGRFDEARLNENGIVIGRSAASAVSARVISLLEIDRAIKTIREMRICGKEIRDAQPRPLCNSDFCASRICRRSFTVVLFPIVKLAVPALRTWRKSRGAISVSRNLRGKWPPAR